MNSQIKNTFKRQSLLNHYNTYRELPGSHDILLTRSLQDTRKNATDDSNIRKLEIDYKIPGTSTKTTKIIPYITDVNSVDIVDWIENFNKLFCLFKWTEPVRKAYLTELIEIDLDSLNNDSKDSQDILNELLEMKYSNQDINSLQSSFRLINQDDYYLIEQYYSAVRSTAKELKLLKNWDISRYKEYLNETFMSNLSRDTKILLTDQQIYDADAAFTYLKRKENLILSEYKKGTIKRHISQKQHQPNSFPRFNNTRNNSFSVNTNFSSDNKQRSGILISPIIQQILNHTTLKKAAQTIIKMQQQMEINESTQNHFLTIRTIDLTLLLRKQIDTVLLS